MKVMVLLCFALIVPTVSSAQTGGRTIPNEHASARAKERVAAAMAKRATHVRGEAVGLDNRPVTPAVPAQPATRAVPAVPNPDGGRATRAIPAVPAHPATPASPSQRPDHAGTGHGRKP